MGRRSKVVGSQRFQKKLMVYFYEAEDVQLYDMIVDRARSENISLTSMMLRMLHGNKVRDDLILALRREIKRLRAKIEMLSILLEIPDPKSREIAAKAIRHAERAKRIESAKGIAEALAWHAKHKGK